MVTQKLNKYNPYKLRQCERERGDANGWMAKSWVFTLGLRGFVA